jgi:hypothetical protein
MTRNPLEAYLRALSDIRRSGPAGLEPSREIRTHRRIRVRVFDRRRQLDKGIDQLVFACHVARLLRIETTPRYHAYGIGLAANTLIGWRSQRRPRRRADAAHRESFSRGCSG